MRIETVILQNCLTNEEFVRQTLPYIKPEYFAEIGEKTVFEAVVEYIAAYNTVPTREALLIECESTPLTEGQYSSMKKTLETLVDAKTENLEWLTDKTEEFCKQRAIHLAIMKSVSIIDGEERNLDKGAIPQLLSDALAVSFDNKIGHDFLDDADARFDFYRLKEERIPFDIEYLNKITKGGLPSKTLNSLISGCVHPTTKVKVRIRLRT